MHVKLDMEGRAVTFKYSFKCFMNTEQFNIIIIIYIYIHKKFNQNRILL